MQSLNKGTGTYFMSNAMYQVDGLAYSKYDFGSGNTQTPLPLAMTCPQPEGGACAFYWAAGGTNAVKGSMLLTNESGGNLVEMADVQAQANYYVQTPSNANVSSTLQPVTISYYYKPSPPPPATPKPSDALFLSLGNLADLLTGSAGITFVMSGNAPTTKFTGYSGGGYFGLSQTILVDPDVPTPLPVADGCVFYTISVENANMVNDNVGYDFSVPAGGTPNPTPLVDAPNFALPPTQSDSPYTRASTYKTYMMFKPPGKGNYWVSLGNVTWSWAGTAVWSGSNWSTVPVSPTKSATWSTDPSVPSWSQIYNPDGGVSCAKVPI